MKRELVNIGIKLIIEFYILEKKFFDLDLEYINVTKTGFILKDTTSNNEEVWSFYNIGQFIEVKTNSILENKFIKTEKNNLNEDLVLLEKKLWIKKYGEILYIKERINFIKKALKGIESEWKIHIKENYILQEQKEKFDLKILLEDILYKKSWKIDDENFIIIMLNSKIMKLGKDKEKIISELIWSKDNIQKGMLDIIIPFNKDGDICIKVKLEKSIFKISLCRYFKNNYNIEYLDIENDEKIKLLNYFNNLKVYK